METIDIALASDHNYLCGLLVTAASMARHASRDVELRFDVLDGGLTESDWADFTRLVSAEHPHCRFRRLDVDSGRFEGFPVWNCGSRMTYARLLLPNMLDDVNFALYCDVDFLWTADVVELWRLRDESALLMGHPDGWPSTERRERAWFAKHGLPFDFSRYVCAGMLLFNLELFRRSGMAEKLLDFLSCNPDVCYVDQTAINAVVGNIALLPRKWHRFSRDMTKTELRGEWAIHFAGDTPWRRDWWTRLINDVQLDWHRFHGELLGIGTWKSLRQFFTVRDIVVRRVLYWMVKMPVTRVMFFLFLRLIRRGVYIDFLAEERQ